MTYGRGQASTIVPLQGLPHYRPARRRSFDNLKTRLLKCARHSVKSECIRHHSLFCDNRITLHHPAARLLDKLRRRFDQLNCYPLAAIFLGNKQTHNRPNRKIIQWLQRTRAVKPRKFPARRNRAPADRLVAVKCQYPGNITRVDYLFQQPFVSVTLIRGKHRPRQPPPHAPASGACAALAKQLNQFPPFALGRRTKVVLSFGTF